jgi:two-component sensor histidine kinase
MRILATTVFLCLTALEPSAQQQPTSIHLSGSNAADSFSPPASSLSKEQQCLLIQLAGSFYNVAKYATVDIDSGMSAASHSLGLSLLPVMTEGIGSEIPAALSDWVAGERPAVGKNELPALTGLAHLQELFLLGSWYAYRTNIDRPSIDSAIAYLKRAVAESNTLNARDWHRQSENLMGKAYLEKGDTASGNQLFRQVIGECRQAKDAPGEARAWRNWAMYFMFSPATGLERIDYLQNALGLYTSQKDFDQQVNVLMDIGYLSFSIQRFSAAKTAWDASLHLQDSIGWAYTHYTTDVLTLMASIQGQYGDNLRNALRSVKSSAATRDSLGWAHFYVRLADIYYDQPGSEGEAFQWMNKSLQRFLRSGGDLFLYRYFAVFLGFAPRGPRVKEAYDLLEKAHQLYPPGNPVDLLYYDQEIFVYYQKVDDIVSMEKYAQLILQQEKAATVLRPLLQGVADAPMGRVAFLRGKWKEAESWYRAYLISNAGRNEIIQRKDIMKELLKIDSALGNTKAELADYRQDLMLRDSIYNTTQSKQLETMKVQYETAERDKDIQLLNSVNLLQESQLKQAAFVRKISFAGIVLLLLIVGLVFNRYRTKQKQKSAIDEKNAQLQELIGEKDGLLDTKEWLLKELHHRVKNNLQVMMSLQELQARNLTSEEALTAVHDSSNRLYALSLIHQKLYQQEGPAQINMQQYIGDLVRHLTDAFASLQPVKVETDLQPDIELNVTQAIPIGLILNEAITNTFKYAFVGRAANGIAPPPLLRISLFGTGSNHELELAIKDNGRGYTPPAEKSVRKSLGLTLVEALAGELEGALQIINDGGLAIILRFTPALI